MALFCLFYYYQPFSSEPNNLISVINLTDLAIKRIIRMTKKISPFLSMCQEDQIALLKGGVTELMILRSVMNYNPEKNAWRVGSYHHLVLKRNFKKKKLFFP